ncbi:4Fe-4S dicluster domain-containing protein [Eggerthellaceae bacterium zg-1084]|uniref:4Fe-4S dicluster domain-containing protein n=1 Tax=Berryella wangjianweii TaxID=2734634 RepID=A0A6M8J2N6_9ACTN|nr:4Fe-4S dicluster domain-containing protein [Berryella wangjianweii]NPD30780.1 4Fe-4S dicluster domain-containing protein [Berryella wangjianweii]QKF07411.1 4Fe-4S dicluster domain-containing protein [Berryella wangjianweii]
MNRFIAVEPDKCIGCGTCQAACSEGHRDVGLQGEPRLSVVTTREISAAITCHHCEGAPCLEVCPVDAITRESGSIQVNEQTCIGCKLCAIVCPFGAVHPAGTSIAGVAGTMFATPTYPKSLSSLLRWEVGVITCAVKCDLCSYDPEGGPRCVPACPTNALTYVVGDDLADTAKQRRLGSAVAQEALQPELTAIRREEQR